MHIGGVLQLYVGGMLPFCGLRGCSWRGMPCVCMSVGGHCISRGRPQMCAALGFYNLIFLLFGPPWESPTRHPSLYVGGTSPVVRLHQTTLVLILQFYNLDLLRKAHLDCTSVGSRACMSGGCSCWYVRETLAVSMPGRRLRFVCRGDALG